LWQKNQHKKKIEFIELSKYLIFCLNRFQINEQIKVEIKEFVKFGKTLKIDLNNKNGIVLYELISVIKKLTEKNEELKKELKKKKN
jgi:hypothetical protein